MLKPHAFSIGGWCLVSGGGDPFGGPKRKLGPEVGLEGCKAAGIGYGSLHDRDLWDDDDAQGAIDNTMSLWAADLATATAVPREALSEDSLRSRRKPWYDTRQRTSGG
jgi:hypothetical protein